MSTSQEECHDEAEMSLDEQDVLTSEQEDNGNDISDYLADGTDLLGDDGESNDDESEDEHSDDDNDCEEEEHIDDDNDCEEEKGEEEGKEENERKRETENEEEKDEEEGKEETVDLSIDEKNKLLIDLQRFKWPGLNINNLVIATYNVLNQANGIEMLDDQSNAGQILFAKHVWNLCDPETRKYFQPVKSTWLGSIGTDQNTIAVLTNALSKFEANSVQGKDDSKYLDYLSIKGKYEKAVAKQNLIATDPFAEALTPGETNLINKYESIQRNRQPTESKEYEKHYPNQNAVTYPYLLGKMMFLCDCHELDSAQLANKYMNDVFKYMSAHGQRGNAHLNAQLVKWPAILGPMSTVDIKPGMSNLLSSEDYITAKSADVNNKYLKNHRLTLKRMIRLVHICSKYNTPWGMLALENAEFTKYLHLMHVVENRLRESEMFSLAMVWYKCINRDNICAIMVDHHEASANNILAETLGKQKKAAIAPKDYAFPFEKNIADNFVFPNQE